MGLSDICELWNAEIDVIYDMQLIHGEDFILLHSLAMLVVDSGIRGYAVPHIAYNTTDWYKLS